MPVNDLACCGHLLTQAEHFMQIPGTELQSAGSMEPIGHIDAQYPHLLHNAVSVTGFTFRMSMGFPSVSVAL